MPNRPIPVSKANEMINEYITYMQQHGVDMQKQTHSVSFAGKELMEWLNGVMPYADEIRIFMGDYPKDDPNAGRTTVILWPYKDGKPAKKPDIQGKDGGDTDVEPYNDGQLMP